MFGFLEFRTWRDVHLFAALVGAFSVALALVPFRFIMDDAVFAIYWRPSSVIAFVAGYLASLITGTRLREVTRLRDDLRERLAHDALTGAKTRADLMEKEDSIDDQSGVVMMIDLDRFKQVNDTYGHATGDLVLQDLVGALKSLCREEDEVYRIGGEEILMFFKNSGLTDAPRLVSRLQDAVSGLSWAVPHGGEPLTVTVSGGWSVKLSGEPLRDHMRSADGALYRAKRAGRNRVFASVRGTFSAPFPHPVPDASGHVEPGIYRESG